MKEIRVGDIYIKKSTKQRLVYVGNYNTQHLQMPVFKEKKFDFVEINPRIFVDMNDLKPYVLNLLNDKDLVKAKDQFTEKDRGLFLIKLQLLGKIDGYSDETECIDCTDIREMKKGTTVMLANPKYFFYKDDEGDLFNYPINSYDRLKLCLTRINKTLYQLDTIIQESQTQEYITVKSNDIDLMERYKGLKEQIRKAIKNYGYLECVSFFGKRYEKKNGTMQIEMSANLQKSFRNKVYQNYLKEVMKDVNSVQFLLFVCLKKFTKEEFSGYMASIYDSAYYKCLTLDVRSKDLILKEPLVIKYYLLREYFDEMYDMVEQILGKTGVKYSIKKLVKEKNWCNIPIPKNENGCYELYLKNFGFNISNVYISEDYNEVKENILETLDKSAYVRMQFITRHFSIVSTLLRNRA